MQSIRVALIQTGWQGGREAQMDLVATLVAEAAAGGATLVCLPEFSLSPYFPGRRDPAGFSWAEPLQGGPSDRTFSKLAAVHNITLIGSLFERTAEGDLFDTATIHGPDGLLSHFTRKVHIPSGEGYHETDFFGGAEAFPVHDIGPIRISIPTCYDQWFPEVARICALEGAELIFYPTAIGSEPTAPDFDSMPAWQTVMRGHAIANGIFVAAANRVGTENDVQFYGSSFVCSPTGEIMVQAKRDEIGIICADLDPGVMTQYRDLFPLLHQRRPALYTRITGPASGPVPGWWIDAFTC